MASLGGSEVAFALDKQLAVTDGMTVTRYDVATFTGLAGADSRAVSASDGKVTVFDATTAESFAYDLEGAEQATFDATGRIVVRTADSVYIEAPDKTLVLRYKGSKGALRGLAASDVRVWFVEGEELAALEADAAYVTSGTKIAADATLLGSPTGDVWVLDKGSLSRYAAETGDSEDRKQWEETVQPLYMGSCTPCHAPGGSAGIDLSTYGAWVARRDVIRTRVVEKKTMPPEGIMFTDAQRKVIADWVGPAP
jgi:mono/diheme cytochrome c family protein